MKWLSIFAGAATFFASSAAHAITVEPTFIYDGSIQFDFQTDAEEFGPEYPNGVIRRNFETFGDGNSSYATISGLGFNDPVDGVTFTNGANAFGGVESSSNGLIRVRIENTGDAIQEIIWNGTIFAGGIGIVMPDILGRCSTSALNECDSYFAPGGPGFGSSAELNFGARIEGEGDLYTGFLSVDSSGVSTMFDGIELMNLREPDSANPGEGDNPFFRWWDETEFTFSLGVFQPGEVKFLEFFVNVTVASTANDGCFATSSDEFEVLNCTGAQAGFGDPDMTGGVNFFSARSYTAPPISQQFAAEVIPLPAAVWLFGTVLAGGFGANRFRKRVAA